MLTRQARRIFFGPVPGGTRWMLPFTVIEFVQSRVPLVICFPRHGDVSGRFFSRSLFFGPIVDQSQPPLSVFPRAFSSPPPPFSAVPPLQCIQVADGVLFFPEWDAVVFVPSFTALQCQQIRVVACCFSVSEPAGEKQNATRFSLQARLPRQGTAATRGFFFFFFFLKKKVAKSFSANVT